MFNKLRNIISHPEHGILLRNTFSLSVLQFANYILLLIIVPYLVRVLRLSSSGAVAFGLGFINYLLKISVSCCIFMKTFGRYWK